MLVSPKSIKLVNQAINHTNLIFCQWCAIKLLNSGRGPAIGVSCEICLAALAASQSLVFEIVAKQ